MKLVSLNHELNLFSKNTGINKSGMYPLIVKKAFPILNRSNYTNDPYSFPKFINSEFAKKTNINEKLREHGIDINDDSIPNSYEFRKNQFEQLNSWMLNGTVGTKLSLYYSLMERDPTNDIRVIKFCLSLPYNQFVQNGLDRALIRRSTEKFLPDKVRLNQRIRGIQGADLIHRMSSSWDILVNELIQLSEDSQISEYIDLSVIKTALTKIQNGPRPEYANDPDFKILMRSLIINRFIKKYN